MSKELSEAYNNWSDAYDNVIRIENEKGCTPSEDDEEYNLAMDEWRRASVELRRLQGKRYY